VSRLVLFAVGTDCSVVHP